MAENTQWNGIYAPSPSPSPMHSPYTPDPGMYQQMTSSPMITNSPMAMQTPNGHPNGQYYAQNPPPAYYEQQHGQNHLSLMQPITTHQPRGNSPHSQHINHSPYPFDQSQPVMHHSPHSDSFSNASSLNFSFSNHSPLPPPKRNRRSQNHSVHSVTKPLEYSDDSSNDGSSVYSDDDNAHNVDIISIRNDCSDSDTPPGDPPGHPPGGSPLDSHHRGDGNGSNTEHVPPISVLSKPAKSHDSASTRHHRHRHRHRSKTDHGDVLIGHHRKHKSKAHRSSTSKHQKRMKSSKSHRHHHSEIPIISSNSKYHELHSSNHHRSGSKSKHKKHSKHRSSRRRSRTIKEDHPSHLHANSNTLSHRSKPPVARSKSHSVHKNSRKFDSLTPEQLHEDDEVLSSEDLDDSDTSNTSNPSNSTKTRMMNNPFSLHDLHDVEAITENDEDSVSRNGVSVITPTTNRLLRSLSSRNSAPTKRLQNVQFSDRADRRDSAKMRTKQNSLSLPKRNSSNFPVSDDYRYWKHESVGTADHSFWPYYRLISDISRCDAAQLLDSIDSIFGLDSLQHVLSGFMIRKLQKSLGLERNDVLYAPPKELMRDHGNHIYQAMRRSVPSLYHPSYLEAKDMNITQRQSVKSVKSVKSTKSMKSRRSESNHNSDPQTSPSPQQRFSKTNKSPDLILPTIQSPIETDPQIETATNLFPESQTEKMERTAADRKGTASSSTKEVPAPINPNASTPANPMMNGQKTTGTTSGTISSVQSTPSQLLADSTTSPGTERFGGALIDDEEKRDKYGMTGYHGGFQSGGYHTAMDSDDTVESLILGTHARHSNSVHSGKITPFTPQNMNGDGDEAKHTTLEQLLSNHKDIAIGIISFLDQKSFISAHRISRLFMYCCRFPQSRSHLMVRVGKMGDKIPISGKWRVNIFRL